jgi:ubiquinone/menaquinone biosynthesis C-methylase UbiE
MIETDLTPANRAAIRHWSNTPCGLLDISHDYDLLYFESVERDRYLRYAPWMRKYLNFDFYRGKRVLEIGVGQGTDLAQFAKSGADVYGIDITPRHLEIAARNLEVRGLKGHLQRAAAAALPFDDGLFDIVYSFGVLHHTDDTEHSLSECYRVLKPGGELILAVYYTYSFFHAYTVVVNGLLRGKLRKLGYRGLMSLVEEGADATNYVPLVKTYSKAQLRNILKDFKTVRFEIRHLTPADFGRLKPLIPTSWAERAGRAFGWYIFARATK